VETIGVWSGGRIRKFPSISRLYANKGGGGNSEELPQKFGDTTPERKNAQEGRLVKGRVTKTWKSRGNRTKGGKGCRRRQLENIRRSTSSHWLSLGKDKTTITELGRECPLEKLPVGEKTTAKKGGQTPTRTLPV